MGLKESMQSAVKDAMRARAKVKLDTIRTVLAAIQYEEMNKKIDLLPDDGIIAVLKSELKKRKESIEFAEKAARSEMVQTLNEEIAVIESFLPKQMDAAQLEQLIAGLKAGDPSLNMGGAMKILKERHNGQYDAKLASELAKKVFG